MHSNISQASQLLPNAEALPVLVAAAQREPAAFAALYDRFCAPVYRYLYSRVGNQADAEDLTTQTFLAALENLPRYREQGQFAAWLFCIARAKVMDFFRRGRCEVSLEALEIQTDEHDPLGLVIQRQEQAKIAGILQKMEAEERELLRLRYVADLSFPEMAALLGKNEAAVKKSLYRLLARIQSQVE
jgi:RNA polymerase sigma-70 factor, ECF subfamily